MVLSLQSGLRSIRQRIPELMASGKSQRKPGGKKCMKFERKKKEKKKKDLTKNTDRFPCRTSISPRNVSISMFVPSSLLYILVP
jgi:hypothetical protein